MQKHAPLLALCLAVLLAACAEPFITAPTPAAQPDVTAQPDPAPISAPIITGSAGPITTTPVTTADPNAPIETVTHKMDPNSVTLDYAADPSDTPGILLLRVTNSTNRQVNFGHVTGQKLEMRQGGEWVSLDPTPIDPADRTNVESTSSIYMRCLNPNSTRLFAYPLDRYSPLAPGEYRITAGYGLADPAAEEYTRYQSIEHGDAAWHFTVPES